MDFRTVPAKAGTPDIQTDFGRAVKNTNYNSKCSSEALSSEVN